MLLLTLFIFIDIIININIAYELIIINITGRYNMVSCTACQENQNNDKINYIIKKYNFSVRPSNCSCSVIR